MNLIDYVKVRSPPMIIEFSTELTANLSTQRFLTENKSSASPLILQYYYLDQSRNHLRLYLIILYHVLHSNSCLFCGDQINLISYKYKIIFVSVHLKIQTFLFGVVVVIYHPQLVSIVHLNG